MNKCQLSNGGCHSKCLHGDITFSLFPSTSVLTVHKNTAQFYLNNIEIISSKLDEIETYVKNT